MRTNGLARASLRFKPASFAGVFVALAMAAFIVSACAILLETGVRAKVQPERYSGAPVVVAADQRAHYVVGSGEDRSDEHEPLPDAARLDASLVQKVAAAPGVAAAVPDLTFPVQGPKGAMTAQGWGSAAITRTAPAQGAPPRAGEVVLDAAAGARPGDRVTLTTHGGPRDFRVSGIARTGTGAWFADAEAPGLAGHPGKVDAVAVFARPGTPPDALAGEVRKAVGAAAGVRVLAGDARGTAEERGLEGAKELLAGLGGSFGGIAAMVAMFTAAGAVALSVGQRARELALLRAIGATPRQIRRSIAAEALLVAPVAAAAGCLPGIGLAAWWFGQLQDKGAIPGGVDLAVSPVALLSTAGIVLATALFAGLMAARRPSKIKPREALAEASAPPMRPGIIRTLLGAGALAGGVVLAGVAAKETGDDAAETAAGVVMLFMLAVALLGPVIARLCAAIGGLPLRAGAAPAQLAAANSRVNARRLASAITPIVLAMAFSSTLVFMHSSEEHASAEQLREGLAADHVVTREGAGLPAGATDAAAAVPGVERAVGVLRTSTLVMVGSGSGAYPQSASTQAVSGTGRDLARVQDLGVRAGGLDRLGRPGTVAIDATLAESAKVEVGDRLRLTLPDGTEERPEVVATYRRGLGIAQVTVPRAAVAGHVTSGFNNAVLVKDAPGAASGRVAAALAPLGEVSGPAGFAAERDKERELNKWANTTMAAVLGGFAAIAAINTLVMTVLDRRRELGLLRLVGSTKQQILWMIRWEALLVTLAGTALGTAIAAATLVPMVRGITGGAPYIPPAVYASFAGATLLLGLAAAGIPARAALRTPAASLGGGQE